MKNRLDSLIAAIIICGGIALAGTGAYAFNDTSGNPPTGGGNGSPIAVEATPEPSTDYAINGAMIMEMPATGAGPTIPTIKIGKHTGWHFTGSYTCDWLGRQMAHYQWYEYSGYHYSVGGPTYSWQYTGRWC